MVSDQQERWPLAFLVPAGLDHPIRDEVRTGSQAEEPSHQPDQHVRRSAACPNGGVRVA